MEREIPAMEDGNAVDAVRAAVAALNDGDIEGYLGSFDPSCLRWVAGLDQPLSLADVSNGLKQLVTAFENLYLHEDLLFGDQRFACARWRMGGRHVKEYLGVAARGKSIDVETCEVYETRGHRLVTTWTYGDLGQLFRQIADGKAEAT
jgi:predicted ester cyclase